MPPAEAIRPSVLHQVSLDGRELTCRLVRSKAATRLRIKVSKPDEVELIVPERRTDGEGFAFLTANAAWVLEQLERAQRRLVVRRPNPRVLGQVLLGGETVPVQVIRLDTWLAPNRITLQDGEIQVTTGPHSRTAPARSLENWLRKRAREQIEQYVSEVSRRVKRLPGKVYIMDQRTKWGNCSGLGNLSFNWRLVMAPDFVLRYIVTHEVVHLAIPDHSQRFWLTVQSLCPSAERARQWLVANADRLIMADCIAAVAQEDIGQP
ncbi:M48 family metallopeptidase [uncultured Thiodictyon sp.]|jgi:predicted metal-dependent hydrolase|uniref:M48 family metallopeptidase n=1 Tax=uncultured Thiodictyon sp. TaxID=1846217 RepID=UPI0025D9F092|nr:M48 family metallopeptidase [uncultured Thiodictyon sp.]